MIRFDVMNSFRHFKIMKTSFSKSLCFLGCAGVVLLQASAQEPTDESFKPGTLAYHLSTNAAAHAAGRSGGYNDMLVVVTPYSSPLTRFANATWLRTCWLKDVQGLSATPIGFSNVLGGQGLPTMVSPRHYVGATHMHPEGYLIAFLDTNNIVHWRKTLQRVDVDDDTSVGILNADLPPSVGFLPVLPANFTNYLPTTVLKHRSGHRHEPGHVFIWPADGVCKPEFHQLGQQEDRSIRAHDKLECDLAWW